MAGVGLRKSGEDCRKERQSGGCRVKERLHRRDDEDDDTTGVDRRRGKEDEDVDDRSRTDERETKERRSDDDPGRCKNRTTSIPCRRRRRNPRPSVVDGRILPNRHTKQVSARSLPRRVFSSAPSSRARPWPAGGIPRNWPHVASRDWFWLLPSFLTSCTSTSCSSPCSEHQQAHKGRRSSARSSAGCIARAERNREAAGRRSPTSLTSV